VRGRHGLTFPFVPIVWQPFRAGERRPDTPDLAAPHDIQTGGLLSLMEQIRNEQKSLQIFSLYSEI
jgi:hypothetical protein